MRFGAMNFPVNKVVDEIDVLASLGFDYLELTLDPPGAHHSLVRAQQDDILTALRSYGMGLVCHLPTFVYTADLSERIRDASLKEMIDSMEVARSLGAEKVVCHPGYIGGMGALVLEQSKMLADESLRTIAREARNLGMVVCLENMFPRYLSYVEPEDFVLIFNHCPELRMTLDIGHAHIEDKKGNRVFRFLEMWGQRVSHIHLSDNRGKKDEHLSVGSGTVDIHRIVKVLSRTGYSGTMTLEIFSGDRRDLVKSRRKVESLFKTY